ncbi:hypothetical protein [Neobacillus niacini]|uniref:hypothetical protein n=1 Tax=Neobacillus niacini TaxID=86668 RepID=UPI0005EDE560|nr:hypothetical protein [Neobacillus niacini]
MKKYWKFAAIIIVIVLSIGTFYVNSATSAKQYPEFVIQTHSGDADEIKPLVLEGSYTDTTSMNYVSTNLKITADGSTYNSRSFLDQVIGQPPTVVKELQEEYRTFMRGKDHLVDLFFENNQVLAYADVNYKMGSLRSRDFKFDISVLNKEDGNINSFTMEVPDGGELEYVFVEDVQMVKDELTLITQNTMRNNDEFYDEKHIYTINMANQKISNHKAINQVPEGQDDTRIDVQLIRTSPTKANEHLIIVKTEKKVIEDSESIREEVINQEIISYNLETKEKEKINVPELRLDENQLSFFDGSTIYFMTLEGQELVVTPYSLVDDQVGQAFSIHLFGEEDIVHGQLTIVKDGKLYLASSQMNSNINADVIVADVKTGEILFKGQLALEDSSNEHGNFELYMHEMFVN